MVLSEFGGSSRMTGRVLEYYLSVLVFVYFFFFQAEDGIRDKLVTGVQTCALPIYALAESVPIDNDVVRTLVRATDHYVVGRDNSKTVIAGYHWFADWGRDTMISLRSEERRVGKECRSRVSPYHETTNHSSYSRSAR